MAKYVYAVVLAGKVSSLGPIGLDGAEVRTIERGRLALVVSEVSGRKLRPERARLAAHHQVLKRLLEVTTPLPMAFGMVVDAEQDALNVMRDNEEAFGKQLNQVAGKVEMGLKVNWDVPNIFEYFLDEDRDLREMRDRLFRGNREPGHAEKIDLGRMFDRALNESREEHTDRVLAVLSPLCKDVKRNAPRTEREVMNLACLIDREDLQQFESLIFEAAGLFDSHFTFDFSGPWAPHNFVSLQLKEAQ